MIDRDTYRRLLGDERMDAIEAEAAALPEAERAQINEMTVAELEAESERLGDPLTSLHRTEAYATRRVQRDLVIAEGQIETQLRGLAGLGLAPSRDTNGRQEPLDVVERADEMLGELIDRGILPADGGKSRPLKGLWVPDGSLVPRALGGGRGPAAHERLGHAQVLGLTLGVERDVIVGLRSVEQDFRDRGVHLGQWLDRHRETLPRVLAVNAKLEAVGREVAERSDRASHERSQHGIHPAAEKQTTERAPDPPGFEM